MTATETAKFTLDTWGEVRLPWKNANNRDMPSTMWSDLDPFTQGYVEALGRTIPFTDRGREYFQFARLAPETLAAILKDCGEALAPRLARTNTKDSGALFWSLRQQGIYPDRRYQYFPPLTASFGADGKVYLRAAS